MRNMSFMLTTRQVRDRSKTVTRRIGWWFLKPGDRLMACVKCQGLGKGGKIEKICEIEAVRVWPEVLDQLTDAYLPGETAREGFPDMDANAFVAMFCKHMRCDPSVMVNRIEFKYVANPHCPGCSPREKNNPGATHSYGTIQHPEVT